MIEIFEDCLTKHGKNEVPIVLHEGYSPDEIVGLADQDNENDEYHTEVPTIDKWLQCKWLHEIWGKGSQQRIADAIGIKQQVVSSRLLYADLPDSVLKQFTKNDFLRESHAAEICGIQNFCKLHPWLDRDSAIAEVLAEVIAKQGKSVTAKHFAERVQQYNEVISYVAQVADSWGEVIFYYGDNSHKWDARAHFLNGCADRKARKMYPNWLKISVSNWISQRHRKWWVLYNAKHTPTGGDNNQDGSATKSVRRNVKHGPRNVFFYFWCLTNRGPCSILYTQE